MKIRNAFLICVMLAICSITGLTHHQVLAATWFDNSGFSYPAPPEVTSGVPGYVPFNNDFSVLSGSNSTILTRNSSNVGLVVNQSKTNQKGAIWSNNPIFDLSKQHQSLAMNLLIQASAFNLAGDGMAFALAGTRPTSLGLDGGAIGVWGQEINANTSDTSTLAASGLQKSAVITFDTFFNQTTYDKAVDTYRHYIGFGYPGETSSYTIDSQTTTINNKTGYPTHIVFPSSASVAPDLTLSSTPASPVWHIFNVSWNRNSNNDGGTLTYSASDVGKRPVGPVVKQVTWSDSDIQNHFGTNKLYIGFTGSTGAQTEDNVLSFRTLPDIVNASGNVKLTRLSDNTTVTNQTTLKTNDALNYHFSLTYDASSNQSWPSSSTNQLVMYVPKSKYLIASQKSIRVTGSDGSSTSVNVDASSATQLKLTGFNNFLQGTSKTITFDIPVNVNGAVDNTIPVNSSLDVSDDTATMVGNNAQV
ncbi:L-type lectin family protein [Lacticaseibacillus saniviri]